MTNAFELLADVANYGQEKRAARRNAVLQLSGLMSGQVRPGDVPQRTFEPESDEDAEAREVVRKAIALYEENPEQFKALVMEENGGTPLGIQLSNEQLTGEDRQQAVSSLASMAQNLLDRGGN